jgi:hypothetical protein
LIVSPRDHIENLYQVPLNTDVSTPEMENIETAVHSDLDLSALVVPIGGLGAYPAMIRETSDINRLAEVVAHEWSHHWLTLQPLGFNYALDPTTRIINETVASLVGVELGNRVVERFYPEHLLPPSVVPPDPPRAEPPTAPVFDFRAEMAETRVRVDDLLAEGRIEEAESYMEERRQAFWNAGYQIRKINQAYFAFYGSYAAEPGGAQGDNPIGPMVLDIWEASSGVKDFLETMAPVTGFSELQGVHQRVTSGQDGR